ncbi:stalk domain-containing protein [Paenibacillus xylaniclasticus]|uniref:stalk domain-containing protein n=1 Tax=Paenibacillus xylaniclasticus TaxID=588083 RepID=UPI000FDC49F5|nr:MULTISPECIES: NPCBM/NEW2 domain-containing protein [Paenibacillus]GFN33845.1 hypothetical protein PCURB6_41050 [Paenibacillus curdlanolyticus]
MLKDKLKGFVAGIIVSTLFAGAAAYAASGGTMIEVFYDVKNIKINKVSKMPTEGKPFLYQGTTYVPLRFVAESLGQKVAWDGKSGTVLIGQQDGPNDEALGVNVKPMYTSAANVRNIVLVNDGAQIQDNLSNSYTSYLKMVAAAEDMRPSLKVEKIWQDYPLNGQYTTFKAKVGILKDFQDSTNIVTFIIEGDGVELYSHDFGRGTFPEDVTVDVKGVKKLTFKVQNKEYIGNTNSGIGVFNPTLTHK